MKHFYLALAFMTRIPVPNMGHVDPVDFGRSALYYPLVGLLIGVLLCAPVFLFADASPLLLAAILTVVWALITGGLHLDGVADGADAWLGGLGDEEKTHRILKDPLMGAAGVIAIVCTMLLKFSALVVLLEHEFWWVLLFTPVLGRTAALMLMLTTPYVRKAGLGNAVTDFLPRGLAMLISVSLLVAALLMSWTGVAIFMLGCYLLRRLMLQRLGGCTGDTIGATVELGEVFWMLGVALSL